MATTEEIRADLAEIVNDVAGVAGLEPVIGIPTNPYAGHHR